MPIIAITVPANTAPNINVIFDKFLKKSNDITNSLLNKYPTKLKIFQVV